MKFILTKILPLALPIIIYLTWLFYARRRTRKLGTSLNQLSDAPWLLITLSGALMLIFGLLAIGLFTGEKIGGEYIPPRLENGKIVKGHIKR
jgi:hypothetical protein